MKKETGANETGLILAKNIFLVFTNTAFLGAIGLLFFVMIGKKADILMLQILSVLTFIFVSVALFTKSQLGNSFLKIAIFIASGLLVVSSFIPEWNLAPYSFGLAIGSIIARIFLIDKLFEFLFRTIISFAKVLPILLIQTIKSAVYRLKLILVNDPLRFAEFILFFTGIGFIVFDQLGYFNNSPINFTLLGGIFVILALFRDIVFVSKTMIIYISNNFKRYITFITKIKESIMKSIMFFMEDPSRFAVVLGFATVMASPFVPLQYQKPTWIAGILLLSSYNKFVAYRKLWYASKWLWRVSSKYYLHLFFVGIVMLINVKRIPTNYKIPYIVLTGLFLSSFNNFRIFRFIDRFFLSLVRFMHVMRIVGGVIFRRLSNLKVLRGTLGIAGFFFFIVLTLIGYKNVPRYLFFLSGFLSLIFGFESTTRGFMEMLKQLYEKLKNLQVVGKITGYGLMFVSIFNLWIPEIKYLRIGLFIASLVILGFVSRFWGTLVFGFPRAILRFIWHNFGGIGKAIVNLLEAIVENIVLVSSFFLGILGIIYGFLLIFSGLSGKGMFESIIPDLPNLQRFIVGGMILTFGILIPRYTYARRETLKIEGVDFGGNKP